jgi:hypothetical protein
MVDVGGGIGISVEVAMAKGAGARAVEEEIICSQKKK